MFLRLLATTMDQALSNLQRIEAPKCAWDFWSLRLFERLKAVPVEDGGIRRLGTQCDSIGLWTTYSAFLLGYATFPKSCEPGEPLLIRSKRLKERYPELEEWNFDGIMLDSRTVAGVAE